MVYIKDDKCIEHRVVFPTVGVTIPWFVVTTNATKILLNWNQYLNPDVTVSFYLISVTLTDKVSPFIDLLSAYSVRIQSKGI